MKNQSLIFLLVLGILTSHVVFADIWRVNNNALYTQDCDHCFSSLQDAVNSTLVSPGDTIHIEASTTNYEGANITKPLVIIGTGYFLDENGSLQQNQIPANIGSDINMESGSEGSTLIGLRVQAAYASINIYTSDITILRCFSGSAGLYFQNNTWTMSNINIHQCYFSKITHIAYADPISNLHITNSYINDGVYLPSSGSNIYDGVFAQNVVSGSFETSNGMDIYNNIFLDDFEQGDNSENNVFSNIFTIEVPDWLSGTSNIFVPEGTVFVAEGSTDGVFQVNPANICPECYEGFDPGGPNTVEIGMFGGNTPYVLSGIPDIPTVYQLHNNTHVYQGDTTHVTISTRSNQ